MTRFAWVWAASAVTTAAVACYAPPPKEKAEPLPPVTQADWQKSINNLKVIGVAIHDYHDAYGFFPADVTDAAGKVLLSWRVQILPFLEQDELYRKFKLDEAWDGPTNKPLVEKVPTAFRPVRVKTRQPGLTFYQGFAGKGAMFDPDNRRIRMAGISDGTSNTALVVEAAVAVEWTKPADLPFDPAKDLPLLGGHFDGELAMLKCDGSVLKVKKDFDANAMKAAITRAGGEVYDLDGLKK